MKTLKQTTLATLVGAAALATAGVANATVVVGGENGYEFSVDGNINQFFIATNQDNANGARGQDNNGVANGLLPTFFGFNVSAPEINGLKVAARVSISPSTNNGSYFGGALESDGSMEQREAYATIDGSFGQVMLGKGLGLYAANNILLDQTLYGVGATGVTAAGDQNTGTTSLGRIGWGYDYANWRSQIRYTTPDMGGFKFAFAVADGDDLLEPADYAVTPYEKDARYEASLSYATAWDNGSVKLWLDGMSQKVELINSGDKRNSNAYTVGGQLVLGGFEAVATYYESKGQGLAGLGLGAFDLSGDEVDGDGYYAQLGYRFGGKTFVAASYGESSLDKTDAGQSTFNNFDTNSMATVGIYHDVTDNLKLVAEYSRMETEYYYGAEDDEVDVFALGGFISW